MTKMEQFGIVVLVKKRGASAQDAKGIKIVALKDDGTPDYRAGGNIIWLDSLKALLSGAVYSIPVYLSPPYVPEQNADSKPVAKER